jgi:single-strand DNA-binding protein|nr:MAG TPA: Single strand binding protein [Caudoviricetes sp.]
MNSVQLIGRFVRDIDIKSVNEKTVVANFSLAVNGYGDKTDFINCVAFNKTAENLAKYTKKGDIIGITGSINTGSYENKKGDKVYTTDVLVNNFTFLPNPRKEEKQEQDKPFGRY